MDIGLQGSAREDIVLTAKNGYFFGATLNGLIALGGTTTSLLFLGFFTSLFPLIWPFAMITLLKRAAQI